MTQKKYSNVEMVHLLHQVAMIYTSTKVPHDYGTGEVYTSVELHTLKMIADSPGISVTELSDLLCKTKGAISQMTLKLEEKGLLRREADPSMTNRQSLHLTDKGEHTNHMHEAYDELHFGESMNPVREKFSEKDINTTFQVLEAWLAERRKVQAKRTAKKELKRER